MGVTYATAVAVFGSSTATNLRGLIMSISKGGICRSPLLTRRLLSAGILIATIYSAVAAAGPFSTQRRTDYLANFMTVQNGTDTQISVSVQNGPVAVVGAHDTHSIPCRTAAIGVVSLSGGAGLSEEVDRISCGDLIAVSPAAEVKP